MKLYIIAIGECSDEKKQIVNKIFVSYLDADFYAKKYDIPYIIKNVYLGDYSYCDYSYASNPLSICDKQGLEGSINKSIKELNFVLNNLNFDDPKESIFEAVVNIEKCLKSLKSFLNSEICNKSKSIGGLFDV